MHFFYFCDRKYQKRSKFILFLLTYIFRKQEEEVKEEEEKENQEESKVDLDSFMCSICFDSVSVTSQLFQPNLNYASLSIVSTPSMVSPFFGHAY